MCEFLVSGELTTRGEFVSSYAKGDKVRVLKEECELLQVVILTGDSKGSVAYIDNKLLSEKAIPLPPKGPEPRVLPWWAH